MMKRKWENKGTHEMELPGQNVSFAWQAILITAHSVHNYSKLPVLVILFALPQENTKQKQQNKYTQLLRIQH